jgi:REP-associated tyrosine transposase
MSDSPFPQRKLHRLPNAVYACTGHEFHFTVCARHQGEPFRNEKLAEAVIESLLWTRNEYSWVLFCYCLMLDHLHFICRLTDEQVRRINAGARGEVDEGVLDHLGRFKSYTTNRSWKLGFSGKLWQRNSYDRVLDLEKPFLEIVQYVLDNPVRKGLVTDWRDWPYSAIVDHWEGDRAAIAT